MKIELQVPIAILVCNEKLGASRSLDAKTTN